MTTKRVEIMVMKSTARVSMTRPRVITARKSLTLTSRHLSSSSLFIRTQCQFRTMDDSSSVPLTSKEVTIADSDSLKDGIISLMASKGLIKPKD